MTNLIEGMEPSDYAVAFRKMADRIDLNAATEFAGAMVIVPPMGDPIEMLLLNSKKDAAVFWSLLKSHAEIALIELQQQPDPRNPWGKR